MRRTVVTRRSGGTGTRRTVGSKGSQQLVALDNRPLALAPSRDGKRVLVTLPYEVLILDARDLSIQRSIELGHERPTVAEGLEGVLFIGGPHLHRASSWGGSATKIGSKLGGHVDRVALLRPGLLAGVGTHGEVLWDIEADGPSHQRKSPERKVFSLVATPDELAVFADGGASSWVIDPNHPSGYSQLRFKHSSPDDVFEEGIVALGVTAKGRCVLGARDGGVAWTHADLRIAHERFVSLDPEGAYPLQIIGDDTWIYVLRGRGLLQRFLIDPPAPAGEDKKGRGKRMPAPTPKASEDEPPLPLAQSCRLDRIAECLTLLPKEDGGAAQLLFGGPHGDGHLGRLWWADPESLAWEALEFGRRELVEAAPAEEAGATVPDFTATKHKLKGDPIKAVKVDDVLAGKVAYWLTHGHGNLLERPVAPTDEAPLPGDALLLPAMLRMREGTARPGLLVWPGTARDHTPVPRPIWLTWGDEPAGWMRLETPQIREQRWSRGDIFPMQIAIKGEVPQVPGRRAPLPKRWFDDELFATLATECKKALKVLW